MGEWLIFIQAIFDMFMECREKRDAERIARRIHRRGPFMAAGIRRGLWRTGLRGSELDQACDEYWDTFDAMPKTEIDDLIAEAEDRYLAKTSTAITGPAPV